MIKIVIEKSKQIKVLRILCVLTFIGSSFGIFKSALLLFIKNPKVFDFISPEYIHQNTEIFKTIFKYSTIIGSINLPFYILSLIGAIMMYKIHRKGFYLYTVAQLALVFTAPVINGFNKFPTLNLILCLIWVLLYSIFFVFRKEFLTSAKS